MFKISFCTVAMNRLAHIKETFIKNILDNIDYPNVEFNLLNYNSTDGLDGWAKTELKEYIDRGIVNYYKTNQPKYFHRSHSRNMIFRLSSGDILCNVDADNFCGAGFAHYINEVMSEKDNEQSFLIPTRELIEESDRNSFGRIIVKREDFIALKGFDERMDGYGFEDSDFINRLQKMGKAPILIKDANYLKGISHSQSLRIAEEKYCKTISSVLIAQVEPYVSRILFLFQNHSFHYATLIDYEAMASLRLQFNHLSEKCSVYKYPVEFENNRMHSGVWQGYNNAINLEFNFHHKNIALEYNSQNETYEDCESKEHYFIVKSDYLKENLIYLFPQIQNRNYMERNLESDIPVNDRGFGKGVVYYNFENQQTQLT